MEKHNFKKDAWIFFGVLILLILLVPGLAILALIPLIAAIYYHLKQKRSA